MPQHRNLHVLTMRPHQVKSLYGWVLFGLLICQTLGLMHRIHHLWPMSSLDQTVITSNEASSNFEKSTLQDHQCLLFDALTVTNCMGTQAFLIEASALTFQEAMHVSIDSFEQTESPFFQPRAPPHSIL